MPARLPRRACHQRHASFYLLVGRQLERKVPCRLARETLPGRLSGARARSFPSPSQAYLSGPPPVDVMVLVKSAYALRGATPPELLPAGAAPLEVLPAGVVYTEFKYYPVGALAMVDQVRAAGQAGTYLWACHGVGCQLASIYLWACCYPRRHMHGRNPLSRGSDEIGNEQAVNWVAHDINTTPRT